MNIFTSLQVACLGGLWAFKQNPATAIFFPSVIGMLIAIRGLILPKFFSEEELVALGDPTPKRSKSKQQIEEKLEQQQQKQKQKQAAVASTLMTTLDTLRV